MMFGTGEAFEYFLCRDCRTLQITEIPRDLARYYDSDRYYSFKGTSRAPPHKAMLKRLAARGMVGRPNKYPLTDGLVDRIRRGAEPWIAAVEGLSFDSTILDVGCGGGARLDALAQLGFTELTGIDPYLPRERAGMSAGGILHLRSGLEEHDAKYDLIAMHHSLEHHADPFAVLVAARERLNPGGAVFVRIPLFRDDIWGKYGSNWAQLDPPRHLYLFTRDAFLELVKSAGLTCTASGTDTLGWSLAWSEAYAQGIPMHDDRGMPNSLPFDRVELAAFDREARELNAAGKGDQGYFVLRTA